MMKNSPHQQKILILDYGSQYSQLIARRVRDIGVYCEIHKSNLSDNDIQQFAPIGIILSGGPDSVNASTQRVPQIIFDLNIPILGICYGMQAMALQLGGKVESSIHREFGFAQVTIIEPSALFNDISDHITLEGIMLLDVWMSHGDHVSELPEGFITLATTNDCPIAAMANCTKHWYGLQFHPEVSHTKQGLRILRHFVLDCCLAEANWTAKNIVAEQLESIRTTVKPNEGVLLALSGGVDSSVAALLLHLALGPALTCVFVDTGFLRQDESEQIQQVFAKHFGIRLIVVDAAEEFYSALKNVSDPEEKRKIAGHKFIELFDREAFKLKNIQWLAQGTIYSDVIESAAAEVGAAHLIKSHHNVGGLPQTMKLKLLEPLRELFKDEVRKIGLELGMPSELINRHPFPGPGLAIRVLGEIQREYVEKLRKADAILIAELHHAELYDQISQAFAVFLPIKSVGVIGDVRQYDHVIALRLVETQDFMTAEWARVPYEFLARVSNRIINEVIGISRVTYDISSKPPATIEWE